MRVGVATVLLGGAPPCLGAQTIDTIIVVNRNVFDAADAGPGFLAHLANTLHVTTRAGVVRRTLLVNPGDPFDSARVVESERALRALGVFSRVRLDTTRLRGRLALRVATTDGWSTKPQLGYSAAGGSVSWLAGLVEDNLLGTATSLTAVFNRTPDRDVFHLGYMNPHFLSRRVRLVLDSQDKSDGRHAAWAVGMPFYETSAPRAVLTSGEAASERVLVFHRDAGGGTVADTFERRALVVAVTGGVALHATTRDYRRLSVSAEWRREDFAPEGTTVFPRSTFGAVGAGFDVGHVRYQVLERFNTYARREDVDLSQVLHVGLWAAPQAWGYAATEAGVGLEFASQASTLWRGGFAVVRAGANGVLTAGAPDSGRVSAGFTVASQNLSNQTWLLHGEGAALRRPKPGAQFDLWNTQNGPRLFAIHEFTGTRMVWFAVEDRLLVADEVWGLMGVGLAPFVDYGGAWYPEEGSRLGGDVGVSLRIGPTRAVRGDVGEFAVGYRFGQGFSGSRWALAVRKGVTY